MATLQSGTSPGRRIKAGKLVLGRAKSVDTKRVKKPLDELRAVNILYEKQHKAAGDAVEKLAKAEAKLGDLDATQDTSVDVLAAAHISAGASRQRPLAEYKLGTVTEIKLMPNEKEAKALQKIATKAKANSDAGIKRAGIAMEKAANAVLAGIKPIEGLIEKRNEAIAARDALAPRWEKAFAVLKRAVRTAEDEGATGLFDALFDVAAKRSGNDDKE